MKKKTRKMSNGKCQENIIMQARCKRRSVERRRGRNLTRDSGNEWRKKFEETERMYVYM